MTVCEVRALIASEVLGCADHRPRDARTSRGFTLRPAQRRTLGELRSAIAEFGGALLADPPGTGKTVVALAAAQGAGRVLVIAPSNLRSHWLTAAERAAEPIAFLSLETLSRGAARAEADLVIIDEAHHLRSTTTRRYANVAAACVGAKVLLLSATPVVNRTADRDALLALFLGSRAKSLSPAELGRCVVRRRGPGEGRPVLHRIGRITAHVEVAGLAAALGSLPPPIALGGGPPATALIVMTLAMAWQSSLAALDAALRRREQRGGALADLLRAGRRPSRAALRHWVLHDDSTQLALPLLVSQDSDPPTGLTSAAMTSALDRHLAAVRELRAMIGPHRASDALRRAEALRRVLASYPDRRVVVFSQHAETVRVLYSAFRGEPGVVAIIGTRVRAAAGRWTRDEVLRAIGPRARAVDLLDPRAVRLVLSTDALAEGVEMQGVGIVVHADLPWTPARLEQRVGRVVRVGSAAREVFEAWFSAPSGARRLVRLGARLAHKGRLRRRAVLEGDARGEVVAILERWRLPCSTRDGGAPCCLGVGSGNSATSRATIDGFVSVAIERLGARLLCGVHDGTRWRVSSSPRRVLSVLRSCPESSEAMVDPPSPLEGRGSPNAPAPITVRRARRLLARVIERRGAIELVGAITNSSDAGRDRRLARVRERLDRVLERAPALVRPVLAASHERLMRVLSGRLETARERRIDELLRADVDDAAFARRLGAHLTDRSEGATTHDTPRTARDQARRAPILLLRRASAPTEAPAAVPPSASPGSAATR